MSSAQPRRRRTSARRPRLPSGSAGAIATSRADVSALVRFVERHVHEMARPQQRIFRDLHWLGLEVDTLPHFFTDEIDGLGI